VWLAILPGQLTLFTCAMILMAYSTRHRGLWLGLAVTLKPQLALLAPLFLLIERDFRQLAIMTAVVAFIAGLATLVFGLSIWATWLHSIPTLKPALDLRGITPVVLSPAVLYGLPAVPVFIVATIFGAIVAYIARARSPQLRLQAMCATSLLAAPYSLKYELAIFAPAMAAYILRQNWKSLVACLPFSGTLGPPSLLIAILQLVDERIPSSTPADNPAQSRDERPC
jgi:hypothetical protein